MTSRDDSSATVRAVHLPRSRERCQRRPRGGSSARPTSRRPTASRRRLGAAGPGRRSPLENRPGRERQALRPEATPTRRRRERCQRSRQRSRTRPRSTHSSWDRWPRSSRQSPSSQSGGGEASSWCGGRTSSSERSGGSWRGEPRWSPGCASGRRSSSASSERLAGSEEFDVGLARETAHQSGQSGRLLENLPGTATPASRSVGSGSLPEPGQLSPRDPPAARGPKPRAHRAAAPAGRALPARPESADDRRGPRSPDLILFGPPK